MRYREEELSRVSTHLSAEPGALDECESKEASPGAKLHDRFVGFLKSGREIVDRRTQPQSECAMTENDRRILFRKNEH